MGIPDRPLQVKLIFNAIAGKTDHSPAQLARILSLMHDLHLDPDVYAIEPDSNVETVVRQAMMDGFTLIVAAGGDGTVDRVADAMAGGPAILGIIPTGTRNNIAACLGIPNDLAQAVSLLREGRRLDIDMGYLQSDRNHCWFLELTSVGLVTDLYVPADEIQHGNLARIGQLLDRFLAARPAHLQVVLDHQTRLETTAHLLMIANMPYLGPHFPIASDVSIVDGLLDVVVYAEMSKVDLVTYAVRGAGGTVTEDPRIKHYRVRHLAASSDPPMPILVDGTPFGRRSITATVRPRALTVLAGEGTGCFPDTEAGYGGAPAHVR